MRIMRMKSDQELLEQLKNLYPALSPEELLLAKENLDRYLLLSWEIYEDLEERGDSPLTPDSARPSIKGKVGSPTN